MPFPPTFTDTWDHTTPPDTQLANLLGQDIRNLKLDIEQRMSLQAGLLSNRPTPETVNATWGGTGFGVIYIATDTNQTFQWNGSSWIDISQSVGPYKFYGYNFTPVTVANTVTNTALQAITIPAGALLVGRTFYFDIDGTLNLGTNSVDLVSLSFQLGSTVISGSSDTIGLVYAGSNVPWSLRGYFRVLTVGISGTVTGTFATMSIVAPYKIASLFQAGVFWISTPPTSITVNTTVGQSLTMYAQFGAASLTNSITSNNMNLYSLGV